MIRRLAAVLPLSLTIIRHIVYGSDAYMHTIHFLSGKYNVKVVKRVWHHHLGVIVWIRRRRRDIWFLWSRCYHRHMRIHMLFSYCCSLQLPPFWRNCSCANMFWLYAYVVILICHSAATIVHLAASQTVAYPLYVCMHRICNIE